jgi:phage tail protein X
MENTVISQQGDTLDAICYRYYGYTSGAVERVYQANRGLCNLGPVLPIGTRVVMPEIVQQQTANTVKLWE